MIREGVRRGASAVHEQNEQMAERVCTQRVNLAAVRSVGIPEKRLKKAGGCGCAVEDAQCRLRSLHLFDCGRHFLHKGLLV